MAHLQRKNLTLRLRLSLLHAISAALNGGLDLVRTLGAVGPSDPLAKRFGKFGAGSCIAFPHGTIFGEQFIEVGSASILGPWVTLSAGMVPGQKMVTNPVIRIGNRCSIGFGSHIVGHFSIDIGDDVMCAPYVYITDQNHAYEDIETPIGLQWPKEDTVSIGAGSWLGTGSIILPGARIGEHVTVAAGAVVVGEVPSRSVVAGVPARVIKQYEEGIGWHARTNGYSIHLPG